VSRILLVRHGRSAHVHRAGWIDHRGFARWHSAYELAGLTSGELPPPALRELAASADAIVASDILRARESALLVANERPVTTSELLREVDLIVPRCGGLRLPMRVWGLVIGARWLYARRRSDALLAESDARAEEAAVWLEGESRAATVLALTHGAVRRLIADALIARGWSCAYPRRDKWGHWSVWEMSRS
jgi:broad specificity phosphatase PhoE